MSVSRRFLIAPSLPRLIRKECGSFRVVEGHFPPQTGRQSRIIIQKGQAHLVLTALDTSPEAAEDRTHLPLAHAEALLRSCPGTVTFERSVVPFAEANVFIDRFITPGPLDLVSVQFTTSVESATFSVPIWFGAEVSQADAYTNPEIALSGLPPSLETEVSNQALEAVLDILESVVGYSTPSQLENGREADEDSSPYLGEAARAQTAPKVSGLPWSDIDQNGHATPDEQLASVVRNLSAALSQSTSAPNGSGTAARSWGLARQ